MIDTPAVFTGGVLSADALFDGLTAGTTTLDITQPASHTTPSNGYTTRNVVVDAPDLTLERRRTSWVPSPDENLGRDLQVERRIGLEVAPPAPGVDVTIEVVDPTVALISTDPAAVGSGAITFPLVTGTSTPLIYVQGLTLNQGTELRITAPGYDQWITTVQIVQAGFYISTGDFTTTIDAANRTVRVVPASLDLLQRVDEAQQVRGGLSLTVDVLSSDPSVGAITVSPLAVHRHRRLSQHPVRPARDRDHHDLDQPAAGLPAAGRRNHNHGNRRARVAPRSNPPAHPRWNWSRWRGHRRSGRRLRPGVPSCPPRPSVPSPRPQRTLCRPSHVPRSVSARQGSDDHVRLRHARTWTAGFEGEESRPVDGPDAPPPAVEIVLGTGHEFLHPTARPQIWTDHRIRSRGCSPTANALAGTAYTGKIYSSLASNSTSVDERSILDDTGRAHSGPIPRQLREYLRFRVGNRTYVLHLCLTPVATTSGMSNAGFCPPRGTTSGGYWRQTDRQYVRSIACLSRLWYGTSIGGRVGRGAGRCRRRLARRG